MHLLSYTVEALNTSNEIFSGLQKGEIQVMIKITIHCQTFCALHSLSYKKTNLFSFFFFFFLLVVVDEILLWILSG